MKVFNGSRKINVLFVFLGLFLMIPNAVLEAMESVTPERADNAEIYVKTSEGSIAPIASWKIKQMKAFLVLLEHQKNQNSQDNPLDVSMITDQELQLLSSALDASDSLQEFEGFYNALIVQDNANNVGRGNNPLSLGNGQLRMLINAAQKVEANQISALCLRLALSPEIESKMSVKEFIKPAIKYLRTDVILDTLQKHIFKDPDSVSVDSDDEADKAFVFGNKKYFDAGQKIILSVQFSSTGQHVLSTGVGIEKDPSIIVWERLDNELKKKITVRMNGKYLKAAFSPDGTMFVCGGRGKNNLVLRDVVTGEILRTFVGGPQEAVLSVAFSPDKTKLVVGYDCPEENIIVWDVLTGKIVCKLPNKYDTISVALSFSPDSKCIAVGYNSTKNNLFIWDISDINNIKLENLIGHSRAIYSVAFSNDGRWLAAGAAGENNNLKMWDLLHKRTLNLVGHPHNVYSVKFGPDDNLLLSGCVGKRNNFIVWDIRNINAVEYFSIENELNGISSIDFSPRGDHIIVGGGNKNLIMYQVVTEQEENYFQQLRELNLEQAMVVYRLYTALRSGEMYYFTADDWKVLDGDDFPEELRAFLLDQFLVEVSKDVEE